MLSLIATDLPRFMACNGSVFMGGFTPPDEDTSLRDEGDAAHWLVEQEFNGFATMDSLVDRQAPNGVFITPSMVELCEQYLRDTKAMGGWVELDTSYTREVWEIRGRSDHLALATTVLYVNDFKFGWKIVEPEKNWTLIWHAVSWIIMNPAAHLEEIVFRIYQPRPYHPEGNVREWRIPLSELYVLWDELQNALNNPKHIVCSSVHCDTCPAVTQCPAAQIANMNCIDVAEKAFDSHVNNEQLSFMLDQTSRAMKMLEKAHDAYVELASFRIRSGQSVPEYSMQSDLSNKQWKKGLTPDIMKTIVGIDLSKQTDLITPNQAKKLGVDENVVEILSERNNKGFKLVRLDEKKKAEKLLGKR